jgi:hypothetical protein
MTVSNESGENSAIPTNDDTSAKTPPAAEATETSKTELSKIEAASSEPAKVEPPKLVLIKSTAAEAGAASGPAEGAASASPSRRLALLAASVVVAASCGALAGALGASNFASPPPAPMVAAPDANATVADETRALQKTIEQLRTEVAALRTSVEAGTRTAGAQLAKIGERLDRAERAQAEPAAKFVKAVEVLDRLERRIEQSATKESTGSSVPSPQPHPASVAAPAQPTVVDGWRLRDVYRGTAVIQGRRFGMMEVEAGDVVPGVGKVEAIRKQDGRWVVVTPKGLIVSMR